MAGDYLKVSKQFLADGLQPTCYSSIDMHDVMRNTHEDTLSFGRDDLGTREIVFTWSEPALYEILHFGLNKRMVQWIEDVAKIIQPRERIIVFIAAHGVQSTGSVEFAVSRGLEYLYRGCICCPKQVTTGCSGAGH